MDLTDIAQRRPARERILSTAYALFTRRGVRAVGIDEIISQSGVAKATMYRHFPTKNDLVLAVLQRREQLWTVDLVERQSRLRGSTPEEQLLAIFDVFHDWFQKREDFGVRRGRAERKPAHRSEDQVAVGHRAARELPENEWMNRDASLGQ